jgi:hypothetical protein
MGKNHMLKAGGVEFEFKNDNVKWTYNNRKTTYEDLVDASAILAKRKKFGTTTQEFKTAVDKTVPQNQAALTKD